MLKHETCESKLSLEGRVPIPNRGWDFGTQHNKCSIIFSYSANNLPIFLYLGSEASEQLSAEPKKAERKTETASDKNWTSLVILSFHRGNLFKLFKVEGGGRSFNSAISELYTSNR